MRKTMSERFWKFVEKTDHCWTWNGHTDRDGYGLFKTPKVKRAHRVAWELEHGPIPDGKIICHTCDNPSCVRPDHLWLGSFKENAADMIQKGRGRHWGHQNEMKDGKRKRVSLPAHVWEWLIKQGASQTITKLVEAEIKKQE
ncbi:MAG: HNH endonuclease signature motif containing protein [Gallionella sp.]|jgi:hypothetical protein